MLLRIIETKKYWTSFAKSLEEYYDNLVQRKFKYAMKNAQNLLNRIQEYEKVTGDNNSDLLYNDMFILKRFLELLKKYAELWSQISDSVFSNSWDTLQDVLDLLRLINRLTEFNKTLLFKFLEKQLQAIEILYPYKVFASIEVIFGKVKCSICGKDIYGFGCPHISGELYRGEMAYGIVEEIKELLSVSLVENPSNKRCKVGAVEGNPLNFKGVKYLSELISNKKFNPLKISHTEEKTKKIRKSSFPKTGRNEVCICGSGKKFKQCCINKVFINKSHVDIIVSNQELITLNDIVNLSLVNTGRPRQAPGATEYNSSLPMR